MTQLNLPDRRQCVSCGREDTWDEETHNWRIASEKGRPFCIHEWDINGTHNPIRE